MQLPGIFTFIDFYVVFIETNGDKERDPVCLEKWKHTFQGNYTHPGLKSVRGMLKGVIGWTWSRWVLSKPLLGANTFLPHSSQNASMVFQAMHTVFSLLHHGQNFQWSSNHFMIRIYDMALTNISTYDIGPFWFYHICPKLKKFESLSAVGVFW